MDLNQEFERRVAKIEQLKDFIVLYGKKKHIIDGLQDLRERTDDCNDLLQQCVHYVQQFQDINRERYKKLMEKAQYTQCVMLNVIEELDNRDEAAAKENVAVPAKPFFADSKVNGIKDPSTPLRTVNRVS